MHTPTRPIRDYSTRHRSKQIAAFDIAPISRKMTTKKKSPAIANQYHHHFTTGTVTKRHKLNRSGSRTTTHIRLGILVGAGIQQQPRAVRMTIHRGQNQRRHSVLRVRVPPMCRPSRRSTNHMHQNTKCTRNANARNRTGKRQRCK